MSSQPNPYSNIEIQKKMQKQKKSQKKKNKKQEQTKKNSLLEKNKVGEGVASLITRTLSRQRSKDPWSKHSTQKHTYTSVNLCT